MTRLTRIFNRSHLLRTIHGNTNNWTLLDNGTCGTTSKSVSKYKPSGWPAMVSETSYSNDVFVCEETAEIDQMEQNEQIVIATLAALENGNITPLVKQELKYSINARRTTEGKETLEVDFREPEVVVLTPDEEEQVEKRKIQNKLAARRFREKQKRLADHLTKKSKMLESDNVRLRNDIRQLTRERLALRQQLENHSKHCIYSTINNT